MENVASRFGQRLAHTEKKYRDQALKKLTAYLAKRATWSALEWDKLWKALFYCMWMSDKRNVQDELSTNLASLVHRVPSVDDALGFVHSFFRTMHREWHGIDGLRLDKFYSLIRKFVHQTLCLLRDNDWQRAHVERVVSILSSEVMSQLPNGLRLHTTDLFLTELHGAAGDCVDTETFLLLLEPFFTLLSSEYDKTVFKRVRELVFLPLLTTYKFGPQPPKKEKKKATKKRDTSENETDGEDEEDDEEEEAPKVFEEVELQFVQHRIFSIASADDTAERNRSVLYELYSHFFKVTKIDSLKASQDSTLKPKPASKKRKQPDAETDPEAVTEGDEATKKKKKNKRRKKTKHGDDDAVMEEADEEEAKAPVVVAVTPEKKSKKTDATKTPVNTPVKTERVDETPTKKAKKEKKTTDDVVIEAVKVLEPTTPESAKKSKKAKKVKQEPDAEMEEVAAVEEETPSKKTKKDKKVKKEVKEEAPVVKEEATVETQSKKEKKSKKDKKQAEEEMKLKLEAEVTAALEEVALSKKVKKEKKEKKVTEAEAVDVSSKKEKKVKKEETAEAAKPAKAKEAKPEVVVRSGMKFRRCGGCGGIGKGLVPAGKECCRHCERTGQLKKKAAVADKKKRKADVLAASAAAAEEDASAPSKKVTFGKNRALAHELSVKRLKASKGVVKELTSDIKGVLKAGSSPAEKTKSKKSGSRMKAADFF